MLKGNLRYALLTTYEKTWAFYIEDKNNLYISPLIKTNQFILAIYYILELRSKKNDSSTITKHLRSVKKFKEDCQTKEDSEKKDDCQGNEDVCKCKDGCEEKESLENSDNDSDDEVYIGSEIKDGLSDLEIIELINTSMIKPQFLGEGLDCVVVKVKINNQFYALKILDCMKDKHGVKPEMKNEINILKFIKLKRIKSVPVMYFGGMIIFRLCILMDYLDGENIDFEDIEDTHKVKYIECLNELHKHFILHGDINPGNFIFKDNQVYIIDFGRSKILSDTDESRELLKEEMNELKSFSRY